MFRKASIRQLLLVAFLLFSGFAATNFTNYYVSLSSLRKGITNNDLPLTGDTVYSEIQRDLMRPVFISSSMANDTFLRDWVLSGEKDPDKITKYLKETQTKYKTVTAFFISDKTKTYYHSDGILKSVSPQNKRDQWYYRVRDMEDPYEINVDIDMANKDAMTIFINYKVFDYDGNFIGATGVGLTVNALTDLIAEYHGKFSRKIYFTNHEGKVTLSSYGENRNSNILLKEGLKKLAQTILMEKDDKPHYRSFKRRGYLVHLDSRYIPEFGWFLFVEQDEKDVTMEIRQALVLNSIVGALITLVITLLIFLVIRKYDRKLERLASEDNLTGISNRMAFNAAFCETLKETREKGTSCSIIMMDIDYFKKVNDTYGHIVGDKVLRNVTDIVTAQIRPCDSLGRWGGEEFVVLFPDLPDDIVMTRAEQIREAVKASPYMDEGLSINVTISLGVAHCRDKETCEECIIRADRALYRAKDLGRNRTEIAQ